MSGERIATALADQCLDGGRLAAEHCCYCAALAELDALLAERATLHATLEHLRPIIHHALFGGSAPDALRYIDREVVKALASSVCGNETAAE